MVLGAASYIIYQYMRVETHCVPVHKRLITNLIQYITGLEYDYFMNAINPSQSASIESAGYI